MSGTKARSAQHGLFVSPTILRVISGSSECTADTGPQSSVRGCLCSSSFPVGRVEGRKVGPGRWRIPFQSLQKTGDIKCSFLHIQMSGTGYDELEELRKPRRAIAEWKWKNGRTREWKYERMEEHENGSMQELEAT